jgi:hypothetical protein
VSEGNVEQHVLHVRENGSERLVRFTGRLVEQTDGWNVYIADDDRVVVHNESSRQVEVKTVEEARSFGSLPRFKKLREELGAAEPEDL